MLIPKLTLAKSLLFLFIYFSTFTTFSQVGIGNINPHPSSMLDITSDSQGILTPRMSTAQRLAISNPANGLMVYDLDARTFYFYESNATAWVSLNSSQEKRDNFKLIKSAADLAPELAAGGGIKYLLNTNTYYEVNGTIILTAPIDLNNAYLSGLDANEDILVRTGGSNYIFSGSTGGSIRNVTLLGGTIAGSGTGTAFSIASTADQNLLLQNTIIANMASVGTISGLGVLFTNIVQYVGNSNGITYNNITNLLLSNQAWFAGNGGTFETFTGTFQLIQKVSGFSTVNAGATAINVSSNPNVTTGILSGTVFSGEGTYINKYTVGSFTGYNFTNDWTVNSPGIPRESDNEATSNFYYSGGLTTGFTQTISNGTAVKIQGNGSFISTNLFRFSASGGNRLQYLGTKTRNFQITGSLSVRVTSAVGNFYAFVIAKNGTVITESNAIIYIVSDTQIQNIAINASISLNKNDFIEVYVSRLSGDGSDTLVVFSENLSIK